MIPAHVTEAINEICTDVATARDKLAQAQSCRSLASTSAPLKSALGALETTLASPRLSQPCDGRLTCAIVGSSGHGKTTLLDEMFPQLAKRGWLVTDVTDTTAQALRIEHHATGSADLAQVRLRSWNLQQIKDLMNHEEVKRQNEHDHIRVVYREGAVEVDGEAASFAPSDLEQFRYPRAMALRPFAAPFLVPPEKLEDRAFIRALTIKEQSGIIDAKPVLAIDGESYHALQLRAVVKDVTLRDPFEQIQRWCGDDAAGVDRLVFVDTPGLAVSGSIKDEVLKHFLEKKSHQVVLELWKEDELDLVVHLVLCGRASDFASLWKDIERECGPGAMDDLQERLILALNGTNVFFTNRDLRRRFAEPDVARREGDHLATAIEDNILQKMSPRGRVHPARVCFVDSKSIVDTLTGSYARAYQEYRPELERWAEPGGVGHGTLEQLGLLESFGQNVDALCDPDDRGQGFLVRQIRELARERGPAILIRKYLLKSKLYQATQNTLDTLLKYYDAKGKLNRAGIQQAIQSCLRSLGDDRRTHEAFAAAEMDSRIAALVAEESAAARPELRASRAFYRMAEELKQRLLARASSTAEMSHEFARYYDGLVHDWAERWGYHAARLAPARGLANAAELLRHCLGLHCREILYQLTCEQSDGDNAARYQQSAADQEQVKTAVALLESARRQIVSICADHGVEA